MSDIRKPPKGFALTDIVSRPYHPQMCCEACVFGRGQHADWCHLTNIYFLARRSHFETDKEWRQRCGAILNVAKPLPEIQRQRSCQQQMGYSPPTFVDEDSDPICSPI